jgi:tripartite-type tricarboxylate transporter receptor subunit TctC
MNRVRPSLLACLAFAAFLTGPASEASAQTYEALNGKTLRFIIGANGGGSTDRYSRVFLDGLRAVLPNATVVAQNVPGGDGQLAIAEAATAGPNAVTLIIVQTGPIYEQLRQTTVPQIDIGKFRPIGSLATNQRLVGVRTSLGATTFEELVALDRQLVTLTNSATAANHMESVLVAAATGIHLKLIVGATDEMRDPLMMAGEADLSVSSYLNLRTLFDGAVAIPLLRTGLTGYDAEFEAVPTLAEMALPGTPPELLEMMDTLNVLGRMIMAVPATDPAVVDALRAAFDEVVASPAVAAAYEAQSFDLSPTSGAEVERRMITLLGDAEAGSAFRAYLACGEEEAAAGTEIDCAAR